VAQVPALAQALAQVPAAVVSVQVPVPTAVVLARVSAQVPVRVLVTEAWVAKAAGQVEALAPGLEEEAAAVALPPASPASERR